MNWNNWKNKYREISERLSLDENGDRKAANVLNRLLPEEALVIPKNMVKNESIIVFGAGPSLDDDLEKISQDDFSDKILITADGATSALLDYTIPDIVVTDLDGKVKDQIKAWKRGAWIFVHAHGDNIDKLKKFVPNFDERIIGTTQIKASSELYNFGGFTDGDRAAFIANELGASQIYLAGMDLGIEVGKYSQTEKSEQKIEKLQICKELLSWLSGELDANLVDITSGGNTIPQVPKKEL